MMTKMKKQKNKIPLNMAASEKTPERKKPSHSVAEVTASHPSSTKKKTLKRKADAAQGGFLESHDGFNQNTPKRKKTKGEEDVNSSYVDSNNKTASSNLSQHKHSSEEAALYIKKIQTYKKLRMQQPKFFLLSGEQQANGDLISSHENNRGHKVILTKRREPIPMTEVMYLLHYAFLGNAVSFQPSWCKILRVAKVTKVGLIILNGVTSRVYRRKRHCFPNVAARSVSTKLIPAYSYAAMIQDLLSCKKSTKKLKQYQYYRPPKETKEGTPGGSQTSNSKGPNLAATKKEEPGGKPPPGKTHYVVGRKEMEQRGYPKDDDKGCVHTKHADHVTDSSPLFGIDCEMVVTSGGYELARVSLVDEQAKCLYNSLIKPRNKVRDYVTKYSGITKAMLDPVQTYIEDAQKAILDILPPDAILVGQGPENDLRALKIYHPHCVDTSDMFTASNRRVKLKLLAKEYLDRDIQCGEEGHDSVEDAIASLDLFKLKLAEGDNIRNYYGEEVKGPMFQERDSIFKSSLDVDRKCSVIDTRVTLKKFKNEPVHCIACSNDKEICVKACRAISNSDFVCAQFHGYNTLTQGSTVKEEDVETTLTLLDQRVGKVIDALPGNSLYAVVMPGYMKRRYQTAAKQREFKTRHGRCVVGIKLEKIKVPEDT